LLNTHLTALADHVENVVRITAAAEMLPVVTRKQAPQKRGRLLS